MKLSSLAKRLLRTLARVIPQCGMVSQAVAFNMFLAFFATLLVVAGLMSSALRGKGGQELEAVLSAILPPGSSQLVSEFVSRPEVNGWYWALFAWIGTVLVGLQVMKLIINGIHLVYGDHDRHSFLGRQIRGLLLFLVTIVTWLVTAGLALFGGLLWQWMIPGFGRSPFLPGLWNVMLPVLAMILTMLILALIYRVAGPGAKTWRSVLPGAAVAAILWYGVNLLFGIYVRKTQHGIVYGGLAAAIGLMAWMELSAMVIFIGAAWNAEADTIRNSSVTS